YPSTLSGPGFERQTSSFTKSPAPLKASAAVEVLSMSNPRRAFALPWWFFDTHDPTSRIYIRSNPVSAKDDPACVAVRHSSCTVQVSYVALSIRHLSLVWPGGPLRPRRRAVARCSRMCLRWVHGRGPSLARPSSDGRGARPPGHAQARAGHSTPRRDGVGHGFRPPAGRSRGRARRPLPVSLPLRSPALRRAGPRAGRSELTASPLHRSAAIWGRAADA